MQGVPPGMLLTEQEVYGTFLLRKPGADELSSPRKEPDLPIIYTGLNAADTIEGAGNPEPHQRYAADDPHRQSGPPLRAREAVSGHQPHTKPGHAYLRFVY